MMYASAGQSVSKPKLKLIGRCSCS